MRQKAKCLNNQIIVLVSAIIAKYAANLDRKETKLSLKFGVFQVFFQISCSCKFNDHKQFF